ncbi:hypothetical protein PsorP6_014347 [Peronosclerospora sorghi]|uniref:Uncharacterized protein n=1 Tax=Peronosclerospora sorghi TaxID=230839 RepID=A0ACC0VFU0_9STRA|nr:hypothetical protein PsorP6_014347 [Peronosclerospora sorghi]
MNRTGRYLLTGGIVFATMQFISGPVADWNARREGAEVNPNSTEGAGALKLALQPRKSEDEE